jgi:tetratricopeptide (TPR) repeat protein
MAGAAFEFSEPTTIEAKGVAGSVAARRLVRALSVARPRGVQGLHPAFVGRHQELGRLLDVYRRAADRDRPVLVTILGDAGVGKTRLLQELMDGLAAERPKPVRLSGRCLAYGHGITYWALGEVLRQHLGILDGDGPDEILCKLGGRDILGLTLGLDVASELHPLVARDRLHQAWIDLMGSIARERPVVVLVEDIHWAEAPLLDLIEQLARDAAGPILLLATARPDFVDTHATWSTGRYEAETIRLEPLGSEQTRELCEALLAMPWPEALRDLMLQRAEGNPLFIEEMLGSLIDSGVLRRRNGSWTVGELPPGVAVPDTVQAVVAARIDLLESDDKSALQAAAVTGRSFWAEAVYELTPGRPSLRTLEDRDFIRRRATSGGDREREFEFKHAMTRDVAYATLPKAKRAHLHAAFAEWVERAIGIRDESASLLAHHYASAVNPDDADLAWGSEPERLRSLRRRAVERLHRAGDLATGRFEVDQAITLYRQALELDPDRDEQVQLWRAVGRASEYRFDGLGLWEGMGRRSNSPRPRGCSASCTPKLAQETATRSGMWTRRPPAEMVQGWIDRAMELTEADTIARAEAVVALCFWDEARPEWAVAEAERLAARFKDPALSIAAHNTRWLRLFAEGRIADALTEAEAAYELDAQLTDPERGEAGCARSPSGCSCWGAVSTTPGDGLGSTRSWPPGCSRISGSIRWRWRSRSRK